MADKKHFSECGGGKRLSVSRYLELFGGDNLVVDLDDGDLVEQPAGAAFVGNAFCGVGERHVAVDPVPVPGHAAGKYPTCGVRSRRQKPED